MTKRSKLLKRYVTPNDKTRVVILIPISKTKLTPELEEAIKSKHLLEMLKKSQAAIYDTRKAEYYKNLLDFYNSNFFGSGMFGNLTHYDYTTPEGLAAIQSTFDYAKSNVADFASNVASVGMAGAIEKGLEAGKLVKGVFRTPSNNGALGTLKLYSKNPIGGGAEAVVVRNTPTTVGKMTSIPVEEMTARNLIPNTIPSKYIGYVKDQGTKLPTYILKKIKVLTEETFPKYIDKLDKAMEKSGFKIIHDPNVLYRAYTNGQVVIDDVSPGNVGLDWLRRPKMIDFNMQSVPEWLELGFTLKKGGKLHGRMD